MKGREDEGPQIVEHEGLQQLPVDTRLRPERVGTVKGA